MTPATEREPISQSALNQLFHEAHTLSAWLPQPVPLRLLKEIYNLARLGPTSEWDTAAAHAVLTAAGGTVSRLDGAPLTYNTRAELLNPAFVAYGPRDHDWLALLA